MTVAVFDLTPGSVPLLVSMPHDGTEVPDDLVRRLTSRARRLPDTDWHISRLYDFAGSIGASCIRPHYSRYVVDLNRPPDDGPMYATTTSLCPTTSFAGEGLYRPGQEPDADEIRRRVERYWRPYHDGLAGEIERLRAVHGRVVLLEAHSIRSRVPGLFEGTLPDLNLGTARGASCAEALSRRLAALLASHTDYSHVIDGRFKGGYITWHYGRPDEDVHAVQLELAQHTYMDEAWPYRYLEGKAARLRTVLKDLLETAIGWAGR